MLENKSTYSLQGFDNLIKLLIIGNCAVGKTNILLNFTDSKFNNTHMTTIGIDYKIKTIEIGDKKLRLQIWDTAGQQRFKTITQTYYKGSMGIILVYSVTDRQSFQAIQNWMKQIKIFASQKVCKVIVGNKIDCLQQERKVTIQQGRALAQLFDVQHYECSAKTGENITKIFYELGKSIKQALPLLKKQSVESPTKSIITHPKKPKKKCC